MKPKFKNGGTSVTFGPVRLSYVHVFEPYKSEDGSEKYQTNILIPNEEKETLDAINAAIAEAKKQGVASKWRGTEPKKLQIPLRDGEEKDDDLYDNHMFINAKSKNAPFVFNKNKERINDPEEVYSGVWACVCITFFPYDANGNKGVACGLDAIMKYKDGEKLGGRGSASSYINDMPDIDDDDDDL